MDNVLKDNYFLFLKHNLLKLIENLYYYIFQLNIIKFLFFEENHLMIILKDQLINVIKEKIIYNKLLLLLLDILKKNNNSRIKSNERMN